MVSDSLVLGEIWSRANSSNRRASHERRDLRKEIDRAVWRPRRAEIRCAADRASPRLRLGEGLDGRRESHLHRRRHQRRRIRESAWLPAPHERAEAARAVRCAGRQRPRSTRPQATRDRLRHEADRRCRRARFSPISRTAKSPSIQRSRRS